MAKIYLTGQQKPITVSRAIGEQVAEFKADPTVLNNEVFRSKDFIAEKREIKSVVINDVDDNYSEIKDARKQENDEYYALISKEYDDMIRVRCNLPVSVKSQDTRIMELVYQSFTGKHMDQSFKDEVIKRQLAYFQKNPRHPYASINVGDIILVEKREEDSIAEIMPKVMLKKAMDIMSEALQTAKRIHAI